MINHQDKADTQKGFELSGSVCSKCSEAVLLMVFNRPEKTRQVFEAIRKQRPKRLYIAADGPRQDSRTDASLCIETRGIISGVDWDCSVQTLFREKNLGCRTAVSTAIDWFFEHEEMGVILEDDCLPHPSFFAFASTLLERYRKESRVMMISGTRLHEEESSQVHGYTFTHFPMIWGWATWRRAWKRYDVDMKALPDFLNHGGLNQLCTDKDIRAYWANCLIQTYQGQIDTWDYQWHFCMFQHQALGIAPDRNLIENIGFDEEGTHCQDALSKVANLKTWPVTAGERHPVMQTDALADFSIHCLHFNAKYISIRNPLLRWRKRIKRRWRNLRRMKRFLAGW